MLSHAHDREGVAVLSHLVGVDLSEPEAAESGLCPQGSQWEQRALSLTPAKRALPSRKPEL